MPIWLMLQTEVDAIEARLSADIPADYVSAKTAAPISFGQDEAVIKIEGPLMASRSMALDFFGVVHTAYSDIVGQIQEAEARGVKSGKLLINSPGGDVSGLYNAMDAIQRSPVKWQAIGGDVVASAAYMLASQAQKGIVASNPLSLFGSVGVVQKVRKDPGTFNVTNTDSPRKRPDVSTEEGAAVVREELDDIFSVLSEKIAKGRGVTPEAVRTGYGAGAVFTAATALSRGMIDSIQKPAAKVAALTEGKNMTLDELKAQHPAVYQEARQEGVAAERRRASAHLTLADASGDFVGAVADIRAGANVDEEITARHVAAGIKRNQIAAREQEAPPVVGSTAKAVEDEATKKAELADRVPGLVW